MNVQKKNQSGKKSTNHLNYTKLINLVTPEVSWNALQTFESCKIDDKRKVGISFSIRCITLIKLDMKS